LLLKKKIERIAEIFLEMRRRVPEGIHEPTFLLHHMLLNVWISKGEVKPVLNYIERMKRDNFNFDWIAYSTILSFFEKKGLWDRMIELYDQMKELKIPGIEQRIVSMIVTAWSRKGDVNKMLEINEELKTIYNLPPDQCTHKSLIEAYGRVGQLENMENYYEANKNDIKAKWEVNSKMVEMYNLQNKPEKAKELEEKMKVEGIVEPPPRENVYGSRRGRTPASASRTITS